MVRIKVYKMSQVAVVIAAVLLTIVLGVILIGMVMQNDAPASSGGVQLADNQAAAEVAAAFAVSDMSVKPIIPSVTQEPLPENEHTDEAVNEIVVEIVRPAQTDPPSEPSQKAARPLRILIYHTHTHEAYTQVSDDPYIETETWRTADQKHSVVRVGEALGQLLRAQGFEVVHDVTDHEPPKLSTAYSRSLQTLEGYAGEHFDLYIALHRDAYNSSMRGYIEYDGLQMAQLMMLIGNGGSYEIKPDYEANLRFAAQLTDALNAQVRDLCRPVMVKNGRYNQHIGTPAILIEVGHNENTLQQALSSMPFLADAIETCLSVQ
jgi:stage II sporulation protein P